MVDLTEFQYQAAMSTYRNAIVLRKYLYGDYLLGKITFQQLYNAMISCDIIIMTNFFILFKYYGLDNSR